MTVALYVNLTRKNAYEVAVNVIKELGKLNIDILMPEEFEDEFLFPNVEFVPSNDFIRSSELLISIGGDGTIIHIST